MPLARAELSSIAELLDQLTGRIATMAEALSAEHDDSPASELFAVERTLQGANRRLGRLLSSRR